jgi:acyl-CoA dehydrogenase
MSPQQVRMPAKDSIDSGGFQEALKLAAQNADDVDRRGRFPSEAIEVLRSSGALAWHVPTNLGGAGMPIDELADATFELSRRCSATGMIFAMHQIQVASIVRHKANSTWFDRYLQLLVSQGRLIASATSEVGIGGDLRRSIAALEPASSDAADKLQFEKKASTISYGAHADDLLTTVRRNAKADAGDQVLVLTPMSEMEMEQTGDWDTLGMRGTCSPGFRVKATCLADQVLPIPFATIAAETVVPVSHILWSNVWLGLATDAYDRAHKFVGVQAHQKPGTTPPAASGLAKLSTRMAEFRAMVHAATNEYASLSDDEGRKCLSTMGYAIRINNLKIAASEAAVEACQSALRICGFVGYKNGGPYSVGRQLRDAQSAALMIANDRLLATNAALLSVCRDSR